MMGNYPYVLVVPSWYPSLDRPNLGIFFKEQAQALQRRGIKAGVVYSDVKGLRDIRIRDLRNYRFQTSFREEDGLPTLRFTGINYFPGDLKRQSNYWVKKTLDLIDKYIRKFGKPDIIHAHSVLWGGYAALLAGKKYNIPYVITEHSSSFARNLIKDWQVPLIREAFENAAELIAVGSSFRELLSGYVQNKKIEVIPNMVDTDFFSPGGGNKKDKRFSFLAVSFLTPVKGLDTLIRAFKEAFGESEDVVLNIGGDGVQGEYLRNLTRELGMGKSIHFLGQLSRNEVREHMLKSRVFVHPSNYETFGVVIIEAMASGLPVIATRCGGPEDIVTPNTGVLVEPGSIKELSVALRNMYSSHSDYDPVVIRDYAVKGFGCEAVPERIIDIYREVLKRQNS